MNTSLEIEMTPVITDDNQNTLKAVNSESKKNRTKEELEQEVVRYKRKMRVMKQQVVELQTQMSVQAVRTRQLVMAWQSRVNDAELRSQQYKTKRDEELLKINSQLMFFQGQLKLEQKAIVQQLADKDETIKDQNQEIEKLKADNKKLQEKLVVAKRRRNKRFETDEDFETSLDNLTRYDSGLGFTATNGEDFLEFQKAYDSLKQRMITTDSIVSTSTNNNSWSEMTRENSMEDDVFRDVATSTSSGAFSHKRSVSNSDILSSNKTSNSDVLSTKSSPSHLASTCEVKKKTNLLLPYKKMFRRHSDQNIITNSPFFTLPSNTSHYASPNSIRSNKQQMKFNSLSRQALKNVKKSSPPVVLEEKTNDGVSHVQNLLKTKHLSLEVDLNESFDSVSFEKGNKQDSIPWYSSDQEFDDTLNTTSPLPSQSNLQHQQSSVLKDSNHSMMLSTPQTGQSSNKSSTLPKSAPSNLSNSDRKAGGFFRDIFNTIRHKTAKKKRERSKSLTSGAHIQFYTCHSEPDILSKEVDIDKAIRDRQLRAAKPVK